jgi:hypothetical protein
MSLLELLLVKEDRMRNETLRLKDDKDTSHESEKLAEFLTQTNDCPVVTENFPMPVFMRESI